MSTPRRPALAITTSQCAGPSAVSCALATGDGLAVASYPREAGVDLAAAARQLCDDAGVAPRDLAEIRIDVGPGSYVGLRVAVTFARFCADFGGAAILAATSLELMAVAAAEAELLATPTVLPVLDARRNRFHCALLAAGHEGSSCDLLDEPAAIPLEELHARIGPGQTILAAGALHDCLAERASRTGAILAEPAPVDATTLFASGLSPRSTPIDALAPLYLMGTYAE